MKIAQDAQVDYIEVVLFTYSAFRIELQPQMHKENKSYVTRRTFLPPNVKTFSKEVRISIMLYLLLKGLGLGLGLFGGLIGYLR